MKKVLLFSLVAALLMSAISSCSTMKNGCPGATSQGRVPGKFKA